ncbi:MAG: alpha/beta hydrolase [Defluviicoccus sp.]|nr:MAG: alpha/beta hydrolase [Defluviicoccus sp.]
MRDVPRRDPSTPAAVLRSPAARLLLVSAMAVSLLTACSPVSMLNALFMPRDGWQATRDIAYGSDDRQRLDVYVPTTADSSRRAEPPRPVVVFFYGGSWRGGRRQYYRFIGEALTRRGYIVVIPDYRVYPQVRFPAFVEDGAAAVAWTLRTIAGHGGNPRRVFLMGHSAGAHIAALLATDPAYLTAAGAERSRLRGFVGLAGPYCFDPAEYQATRPVFADTPDPAATMPCNHADGEAPPMLLLHGTDDETVWPKNSQTLARRVTAAGGAAELREYPGTGHLGIVLALAKPFRRSGGVLDEIDRFLSTRSQHHPETAPVEFANSVGGERTGALAR